MERSLQNEVGRKELVIIRGVCSGVAIGTVLTCNTGKYPRWNERDVNPMPTRCETDWN